MRKLLAADFMRMFKGKVFWIGMILMAVCGVFSAQNQYSQAMKYGSMIDATLDEVFFTYAVMIGVLCAVFCSLFLGTDYSDGTIRNKLIVGHTRLSMYVSNLIVSITAALLMCIAFIVSVSVVGIPLLGFLNMSLKKIFLELLGSTVMVVAFCALCTSISMLNQNKTTVAVISIVGFFALLFTATYIGMRLDEPEYNSGFILTEQGVEEGEPEPNPNYLNDQERRVYEFLYDFLPTGQAMQYSSLTAVHLRQMILYSMVITVVSTGIGIFAFQRKDIK